jgi:hypothetical protein
VAFATQRNGRPRAIGRRKPTGLFESAGLPKETRMKKKSIKIKPKRIKIRSSIKAGASPKNVIIGY